MESIKETAIQGCDVLAFTGGEQDGQTEIWENGSFLFEISSSVSVETINYAIATYRQGYQKGLKAGERDFKLRFFEFMSISRQYFKED